MVLELLLKYDHSSHCVSGGFSVCVEYVWESVLKD